MFFLGSSIVLPMFVASRLFELEVAFLSSLSLLGAVTLPIPYKATSEANAKAGEPCFGPLLFGGERWLQTVLRSARLCLCGAWRCLPGTLRNEGGLVATIARPQVH
jgi:hypothetical protein